MKKGFQEFGERSGVTFKILFGRSMDLVRESPKSVVRGKIVRSLPNFREAIFRGRNARLSASVTDTTERSLWKGLTVTIKPDGKIVS